MLTRREMFKTAAAAIFLSGAGGKLLFAAPLDIINKLSPLNRKRPPRPHTRYIILHTTEGGDEGSLNKLVRYGEAHYFVARTGKVYRIIDKNKIATHAGRSMWEGHKAIDEWSIGIEVSGYHNRDITAAQYDALKELLRQLRSQYKIPADRVLTHSMVAYGNPNTFHDAPHRGRKRCGMLFGNQLVRKRLGLLDTPDEDQDVKAGRLIVGDKDLFRYLFAAGRVSKSNTGALAQSDRPAALAKAAKTAPPAGISPEVQPLAAKTASAASADSAGATATDTATGKIAIATPATATTAESGTAPTKIASKTSPPAVPEVAAKTEPQPVAATTALDLPAESMIISQEHTAWQIARENYDSASTVYIYPDGRKLNGNQIRDWKRLPNGTRVILGEPAEEETFDGFLEIGKDGDTPQALAGKAYASATTIYFFPGGLIRTGAQLKKERRYRSLFKNPPAGTRILVGYVYGGYIKNRRPPSAVAGIKWNYPSTYYRYPNGHIINGDNINDKTVPVNTLIFFQE